MRHFTFLLFFTLFISFSVYASESATLTGRVTDGATGEPVPHVTLKLKSTDRAVSADKNGSYRFENLSSGHFVLVASRIGYMPAEMDVDVAAGGVTAVDVALKAEAVPYREVLVTATRERSLTNDVAVAHQILDHEEIEEYASQNIGEVLENAQSLFIKNYGHIGALKTASIRGASETQILVLLDGQRLNQAQGVAPDLSDIPLHAVERVEVIRGGHSALYGTDAVGGVVNVITRSTRNGPASFARVNSMVGSFGTRVVQTSFGQNADRFGFYIAHDFTESDGDFEFNGADGEQTRTNNDLRWNNTFMKFSYSPGPKSNLSAYLQYHNADRGSPGPVSFPSELAAQKDRSYKANLRYEQIVGSSFDYNIQAIYHNYKQNFDDPNESFPIHSQHKNDVHGVNVEANWLSSSDNKVTAGYELRQDRINSTDVAEQERTIHSAFIQDQFRLPFFADPSLAVKVIPAVRVDKYSDIKTQVSPKAGVLFTYASDFDVTFRSNWGRSYRVPSFNDLYWPAGPFTAGNPDLVPEKGYGFDVGGGLNIRKAGYWGVEVTYFQTDLENLIVWVPGDDFVFSPTNVQDASINGLETTVSFEDMNNLVNLTFNYNYLDAVDNSAGENQGSELIYRPRHKAYFKAGLNLSVVHLYGIYHHVGRRFTAADNSTSLDDYSLLNVGSTIGFPLYTGRASFRLELRNALDKDFQVIQDFPMPRRELRAGFGFEF